MADDNEVTSPMERMERVIAAQGELIEKLMGKISSMAPAAPQGKRSAPAPTAAAAPAEPGLDPWTNLPIEDLRSGKLTTADLRAAYRAATGGNPFTPGAQVRTSPRSSAMDPKAALADLLAFANEQDRLRPGAAPAEIRAQFEKQSGITGNPFAARPEAEAGSETERIMREYRESRPVATNPFAKRGAR